MSRRHGVAVTVKRPAEGGEPPHRYLPVITAEVRAFWPPYATLEQILAAVTEAAISAAQAIERKKEQDVH